MRVYRGFFGGCWSLKPPADAKGQGTQAMSSRQQKTPRQRFNCRFLQDTNSCTHMMQAPKAEASLVALLGMAAVPGKKAQPMQAKQQQLTLETPTCHFRHTLLVKAHSKLKAKPLQTDNLFSPIYRVLQTQNIQRLKSNTKKSTVDKSSIKTSSHGPNSIDGRQLLCISATSSAVWEEQHIVVLLTVGKPINLWLTHAAQQQSVVYYAKYIHKTAFIHHS